MTHLTAIDKSRPVKVIERVLFNVRWTLLLFYLGLVVVMGMYAVAFASDIWHTIGKTSTVHMGEMKNIALEFIDVVMIANLIKMIVTGSYNSFVSKDHGYANENISSGMLKVKIASSVVLVLMIHLLRVSTEYEVNLDLLYVQLMIFGAIVVGSVVLTWMEYVHIKGEAIAEAAETPHTGHNTNVAFARPKMPEAEIQKLLSRGVHR